MRTLSPVHIYQMNVKWGYVDGSAKANEQWRMFSFKFGSVSSDVGKLNECQRMFV